MSVAVKKHPINIRFKPRTPARVISSVKKQYSNYILNEDEESVNYFETDLHKEISERMTPDKHLRTLRTMSGWTLAETGKKIGVTPFRVSDYETGKRGISKTVAKKLAAVFNTSPAVFI
jgi:DNA-binding XRE family transcriptional regulator